MVFFCFVYLLVPISWLVLHTRSTGFLLGPSLSTILLQIQLKSKGSFMYFWLVISFGLGFVRIVPMTKFVLVSFGLHWDILLNFVCAGEFFNLWIVVFWPSGLFAFQGILPHQGLLPHRGLFLIEVFCLIEAFCAFAGLSFMQGFTWFHVSSFFGFNSGCCCWSLDFVFILGEEVNPK